MSGYLSRIVQTANSANSPLRPLAGSVFGAHAISVQPSHLNDTPSIMESEALASPPDASKTQRHSSEIPSSPAPELSPENYVPLQPRQRPPAQTFLRPLQDSRAPFESLHMQSREQLPAAESNQAHTNSHSAENPPATSPPVDSNASQAADKHAFAPRITHRSEKVREQFTSHPAQTDPIADKLNQQPEQAESKLSAQPTSRNQSQMVASQTLIPVQPASMVRQQQPPIRDQRAAPAPEPSIEIHIGRIEVLAVQPPAAPAPAPRRDRSTSLADYLAGQNGRRS